MIVKVTGTDRLRHREPSCPRIFFLRGDIYEQTDAVQRVNQYHVRSCDPIVRAVYFLSILSRDPDIIHGLEWLFPEL